MESLAEKTELRVWYVMLTLGFVKVTSGYVEKKLVVAHIISRSFYTHYLKIPFSPIDFRFILSNCFQICILLFSDNNMNRKIGG